MTTSAATPLTLLRMGAALAVLATGVGATQAAGGPQSQNAAACSKATSSLAAPAAQAICRSASLLGETLLVRAQERLRQRFAQPTEAAELKDAVVRWDERLGRCGPDESCLSSMVVERRKVLESELQARAGRWPSVASWRSQGGKCSLPGAALPVTDAVAGFSYADTTSVTGLFVQATDCGHASVEGYWHGALNGNLALVHDFLPPSGDARAVPSTWLVARYGGAILVEPVMGSSAFGTLNNARYDGNMPPQRAGSGAGLPTRPAPQTLESLEDKLAERLEAQHVAVPRIRWPQ